MSSNIHGIKDLIFHKSICVLPWHGFTVFPNGNIKNCAISEELLGNLHNQSLPDILNNKISQQVRQDMQQDNRHDRCKVCYRSEDLQPESNTLNKVSNRIWYMKVMKNHDLTVYSQTQYVESRILDLRWRNTCNFACVYCGPDLSSKWASELNDSTHTIDEEVFAKSKSYVLENLKSIRHVYLAGGEPLLIVENQELLERLKIDSPNATVRVNTNLSIINNKIFNLLINDFKDTKWTISVDSIGPSYEYIRYPGIWSRFNKNLNELCQHTKNIDFNMTWSVLNAYSIFEAIDFLQKEFKFPDSVFVIQPVFGPDWLFINNLPDHVLEDLKEKIRQRLLSAQSDLYRNSLNSMLSCLDIPWNKQLDETKRQLEIINQRRNLDFTDTLSYLN
jgi:radical SAM protein with 4Fe4S-binding SPASM domain